MYRVLKGKDDYNQEVYYIERYYDTSFLFWKGGYWQELRTYWMGGEDSIGTRVEFKTVEEAEEYVCSLLNPVSDKVISVFK